MKAGLVFVGEEFPLDSGDCASRDCGRFFEAVWLVIGFSYMPVGRAHANGSDAVRAEVEEDSQIVLVRGAAGSRLASPEPAFGSEMFEEGVEPASPVMVTDLGRQRACDALPPPLVVDEARVASDLSQLTGGLTLEGDDCGAVRDFGSRSIYA